MAEAVVLVVDDLMFLPKLEGELGKVGYQTLVATIAKLLTGVRAIRPFRKE